MKKILLAFFIAIFACAGLCSAKSFSNSQTIAAAKMYKNKNYVECIQVMHSVLDKDPSNVLAYYYIAISQARLGQVDKAKEAYQRVIDLNSSTQLSKYSQNGIECLDDSTKCRSELNLDPSKQAMEAINKQMQEGNMQSIKSMVNQNMDIEKIRREYSRDFKDYSKPQNQIQNKSALPTKEEIADALDVLKRAGYQNYLPQAPMSPEMVQMSMLNSLTNTDNNNNQSGNSMLDYYMSYMTGGSNNQYSKQIDPQFIQSLMTTSMMQGSGF